MIPNPIYHASVPAGDRWAMQYLPFYARWFRFLMTYPGVAAGTKMYRFDPDYEGKSEAVDEATLKAYRDHNVQVVTLTDEQYNQWLEIAKKSSYAEFAKDVPDGKKLIDEALSVK